MRKLGFSGSLRLWCFSCRATLLTVLLVLWNIAGNSHAAVRPKLREYAPPTPSGSFSPRVTAMRDNGTLLTWLEPTNERLATLRASVWREGAWSAPATIVAGQPFNRHASESPGIVALSEKNLIAYWSQKPPYESVATQEADVYFSLSTDRGLHWMAPILASSSGTGEESSYPSAAPVDATHAALVWLDGRNWKKQKREALMSRTVQSDGSATEATVIDPDTCTCCPTSLVTVESGLLAAYRGHTSQDIRDIWLLPNVEGRWSKPRVANADNWHLAGCPVNGPNLDVDGPHVALVWFSAPQNQPEVLLAFSDDGGSKFRTPIRIDDGNPVGRAQVALLQGRSALAFWLENKSGTTRLLGRRVQDDKNLEPPFEITRGSGLGYPHVVRTGKRVFITWADEKASEIHFAVLESE